jgi:hypothetical protein
VLAMDEACLMLVVASTTEIEKRMVAKKSRLKYEVEMKE